jgi:hypothetical protein
MSQIMKKTFLTFGLLSLMMVLTSFRAPEIGGGNADRRSLSEIGGGNADRRSLSEIGGGNADRRSLSEIGGGNADRRS